MAKDKETEKKAFAARFNQALDIFGVPPKNQGRSLLVAEIFGLTQRGAARWINGEVYPPKLKRRIIAEKLGVNYDWLEFNRGQATNEAATDFKVKSLPTLSLFEAVDYKKAIVNFTGARIAVGAHIPGHCFVVKSSGKAMAPQFPEGTCLVVDPKEMPKDGDFVIASVKKIPEAIFRQLVVGDCHNYLMAMDPSFKSIELIKSDKIIGVIIEAKMTFR